MFTIDQNLIFNTSAVEKIYHKGEIIITEGSISPFFMYLIEGDLSVYNFTEEGKEFLQHKVLENNFFGEPAVLLEKPFPGSVEVCSDTAKVLKIGRQNLLDYMIENPEKLLELTKSISEKSIIKSKALKNIVFLKPEDRIYKQLDYYKRENGYDCKPVTINMTRKEISNMTGLRIETIIRTVKKMEKDGKLKIKHGKIIY